MALMEGREHITAADVQAVVVRSLQHRIILNFEGVASGIAPAEILQEIVAVTSEATEEITCAVTSS